MSAIVGARNPALTRRRRIATPTVVLRVYRGSTGDGGEHRQGEGG